MPSNDPADVFKHISMGGKDQCWAWLGTWGGRSRDRRPYFMAHGERTMAYRWVWRLVNGSDPLPGQMILHSCDNGGWPVGCCNPAHLSIGSHEQNMEQMRQRERHGLPATAVAAIRRLLAQGDTQQSIADKFGVSRETISAIATGRVYKPMGGSAAAANIPNPGPDISTESCDDNGES